MPFQNHTDAGKKLAQALGDYRGQDVVVLALPRGGVPVAREVAAYLEAPLDILLVRKIGAPYFPELAIGAVTGSTDPVIIRNQDVIELMDISTEEFEKACQLELAEIKRRQKMYLGDRPLVNVEGRTVIVVDDGIATGATMLAAIAGLKQQNPGKIILGVPVAPPDIIRSLEKQADTVVCCEQPLLFRAVGQFYTDFHEVTDSEVRAILSTAQR